MPSFGLCSSLVLRTVLRLIVVSLPSKENVVGKNSGLNASVNVNKAQFLNAIDRATVVATDLRKIVKLDIKENYMTVMASSEVGKMSENVLINLEGRDLTIAFNAKFISECVKAIDDEFINIYFNNKIEPCVIKPYSGNDYLYLIVPLRINA